MKGLFFGSTPICGVVGGRGTTHYSRPSIQHQQQLTSDLGESPLFIGPAVTGLFQSLDA